MLINISIQYDPATEHLEDAFKSLNENAIPKTIENHGTINFDLSGVPSKNITNVTMLPVKNEVPESEEPTPTKEEPKVEEEAPAKKMTKKKPAKEAPTVSKSDVLAIATALSKAGKKEVLKEIFAKFNAIKLSDIAEEDYPELMKALGEANA